jgi:hypothetical protein
VRGDVCGLHSRESSSNNRFGRSTRRTFSSGKPNGAPVASDHLQDRSGFCAGHREQLQR